MKKKVIKELQKLLELCMEINEKTEHNTFLDYAGHVDTFQVRIYENGYSPINEAKYLTDVGGDDITLPNINKCRQKLLKYKEW